MSFAEPPLDGSPDGSAVEPAHATDVSPQNPVEPEGVPSGLDDLEALATGTWLSVPPGGAPDSQSVAEPMPPLMTSDAVVRKVLKYGSIGLAIGLVTASGAYALSAFVDGRVPDPVAAQRVQAAAPMARPPAPVARAELPLPGSAAEVHGPAEPTEDPAPELGWDRSPLNGVPDLGLAHDVGVLRAVVRPGPGAGSGRREPRGAAANESSGIPTARYPDILLSDDPVMLALIAEEVAQLKRARLALERGNAAAAWAELESYRTTVSSHVLETEAMALAAEALLLENRRGEAAELASRVLARQPEAPLAARMSAIASSPK